MVESSELAHLVNTEGNLVPAPPTMNPSVLELARPVFASNDQLAPVCRRAYAACSSEHRSFHIDPKSLEISGTPHLSHGEWPRFQKLDPYLSLLGGIPWCIEVIGPTLVPIFEFLSQSGRKQFRQLDTSQIGRVNMVNE